MWAVCSSIYLPTYIPKLRICITTHDLALFVNICKPKTETQTWNQNETLCSEAICRDLFVKGERGVVWW